MRKTAREGTLYATATDVAACSANPSAAYIAAYIAADPGKVVLCILRIIWTDDLSRQDDPRIKPSAANIFY
jgi:hypothetical protein